MNHIDHTDCHHPATKSGRAACRRARAKFAADATDPVNGPDALAGMTGVGIFRCDCGDEDCDANGFCIHEDTSD